jgi:hypothetical protein
VNVSRIRVNFRHLQRYVSIPLLSTGPLFRFQLSKSYFNTIIKSTSFQVDAVCHKNHILVQLLNPLPYNLMQSVRIILFTT